VNAEGLLETGDGDDGGGGGRVSLNRDSHERTSGSRNRATRSRDRPTTCPTTTMLNATLQNEVREALSAHPAFNHFDFVMAAEDKASWGLHQYFI
jgi:hypothetical protein